MGYSCTVAADDSLDAIEQYLRQFFPFLTAKGDISGWAWKFGEDEYFFERGRENVDGAITGSVYRMFKWCNPATGIIEERCRKVGSVRIEPDGTVTRYATLNRAIINAALLDFRARNRRHAPVVGIGSGG